MQTITIDQIINTCAGVFNVEPVDILGKSRKSEIVKARQAAISLSRHYTKTTLKKIGEHFGRDHTTVIHALRVVNNSVSIQDAYLFPYMDKLHTMLN